jgi:hypothetical protein
MAGVSFSTGGSTKSTEALLRKLSRGDIFAGIQHLAQLGVNALASATPKESGLASHAWYYKIEKDRASLSISWCNFDVERGFPVALMLQYGYTTGTGGYVQGRDYINPAMKPVFDLIEQEVWKAVISK